MTPKPRREHPAVTLTIQESVTETVQRSYGPDGSHIPPKAIAQDMNVALSVLYDIADERRPRQLRAAELPALVRASGNALVLTVVTRAVGGVFVRLPDATSDEAVYQAMSLVVKIKAFRLRMQTIRGARDERDFYVLKSLRFKKLEGQRKHQYSMRLNK